MSYEKLKSVADIDLSGFQEDEQTSAFPFVLAVLVRMTALQNSRSPSPAFSFAEVVFRVSALLFHLLSPFWATFLFRLLVPTSRKPQLVKLSTILLSNRERKRGQRSRLDANRLLHILLIVPYN